MAMQCRPGEKAALQTAIMDPACFGGQRLFECTVTTVSALMRRHDITHVALLKIDVEGCEEAVLQGIADADWKVIDHVALEVHGHLQSAVGASNGAADVTHADSRASRARALLMAKGFQVTYAPGDLPHIGMMYAARTP